MGVFLYPFLEKFYKLLRKENNGKMDKNEKILRNQFIGVGEFNIPKLYIDDIDIKEITLMGYDRISSKKVGDETNTIHFFLDDTKFEGVYTRPDVGVKKLAKYKAVLTPDFSLYTDMPRALQIYNVFKNRWCGAYWQDFGLKVIPTVGWSDNQSYSFCFDGIERKSIVAVSTLGAKKEKQAFLKGYDAMIERIDPSLVICYDLPFKEMKGDIVYVNYLQATGRAK